MLNEGLTTFKASPEKGTTPIPNLLLEAIAIAALTSKGRAVALFLVRRTIGWQIDGNRLCSDVIPLTIWAKILLVTDPASASKILARLVNKGVILRNSSESFKGYSYSINMNIATWQCIDLNLLSEMKALAVPQMARVPLVGRTTPPVINSSLRKETKRNYPEGDRRIKDTRRQNNDPDKYIRGPYGHMVRR